MPTFRSSRKQDKSATYCKRADAENSCDVQTFKACARCVNVCGIEPCRARHDNDLERSLPGLDSRDARASAAAAAEELRLPAPYLWGSAKIPGEDRLQLLAAARELRK